jgi:hypothetical protein
MTKPFTEFQYDDAAELLGPRLPATGTRTFPLPANRRRSPVALAATEFYNGNHWQDSLGFIGQLPPNSLPGAAFMLADIKAGFVSENVVQEVIETHVGGILGREPIWSFLPSEGEADRANKASFENVTGETLTPWWNERKALRDLQKAVTILLCESVSVRRLFFPRKGVPLIASNLADALKSIYFETVTADTAGVFTDPDTQADIGIFLFEEKDAEGTVTSQCAELSFLDEDGNTACRVVRDKGDPTDYGPYQLGGRLLICQLDRRALITEQVQSNQRALNLAHTMMMRNVNMAGSRERTVTNAQPPIPSTGKVSITSVATKVDGRFPGTFKTGAGAVNFVMGYPIHDEDGNIKGYTNPNVNISDPVSVETFVATSDHYREAIYSQCHQRHVLIVDKADTSGRAREVARREFERSLKETKTIIDAAGRWQLETTLRLAAQVSNQVSRYAQLRADFNCLIDAGEPDPAKQQQVLEMRKPGGPRLQPLISDETARNWAGVEDAAAELAKIEQEAQQPPADPTPMPSLPLKPSKPNGQDTALLT